MSDKMEKWELQELVDEAVATGQILPEMINEYVYEFKQGGKTIQDLTAASYHQLALNRNITTKEITREEMPEGILYTVCVVDTEGQERYGVAYEPYLFSGKFDRFCYQKALTKATRNAIKQLVSATERFDTIAKLKGLPMTVETPALPTAEAKAEVSDDVPIPKEKTPLEKVRAKCFAMWRDHQPLEDGGDGRLPANFWDRVKARFGVKSRSTMTYKNWQVCLEMIDELLAEVKESKDVEN